MIIKASQDYYSDGSSSVTDAEFDNMLDQLKKESPNDPLLTAVGHGYNIENDTTYGKVARHDYGVVGSLPKCHDYVEYRTLMKQSDELDASWKLDGNSIVLYYERGVLTKALKRSNGLSGIEVTPKVLMIDPDLKTLQSPLTCAVRGEIVMSCSNFELYLEDHPDAANPRNTAAGLMNSIELSPDLKYLSVVVYNVIGCSYSSYIHEFSDYEKSMNWLRQNFKEVVAMKRIKTSEATFLEDMEALRAEWDGTYPGDGIVLTYTDIDVQKNDSSIYLSPKACAFKFKAETAETTVVDVEWNLGKTKNLIPRIQVETVNISGTNVSWIHGDNARSILNRGIGPGAKLRVLKSGEIIPDIDAVLEKCEDVVLPSVCPSCGCNLIWNGMHLACPNRECADSDIQDVLIWMANIAPYMGLGDVLKLKFLSQRFSDNISIESIYEAGRPEYVETPSVKYNDFQKMYGMLWAETVDLTTAIKALNVTRLGDVNAAKLARYPDIVDELAETGTYQFSTEQTKAIGEANCKSILENGWKFKRLKFLEGRIDKTVYNQSDKKVAITGKLSMKRDLFEKLLKSKGFIASSSVTKDTYCLITDNPTSDSTKNRQAEKLNIPKMTEREFTDKFLKD